MKIIVDKSTLTAVNDSNLNSPLQLAVELKRLILIKYLLSHGADVSSVNLKGQAALHVAVEGHHAGMISNILRQVKIPVIHVRDNTGQASPALACAGGYTEIVSILLENGATTDLTVRAWGRPETVVMSMN